MLIEAKMIEGKSLTWLLRCAVKNDAAQMSELRIKIDGETEYLDREPGEGMLTAEDFERIIYEDSIDSRSLFLVAQVNDRIIGFTRCIGNKLSRFRHKAEFGICISKEYWGYGIGKVMLGNILAWADASGIKKVSLSVVEENEKAIQLYKKYGFIQEGLLVKDRIHKDGKYYNTVIMSRFSEIL